VKVHIVEVEVALVEKVRVCTTIVSDVAVLVTVVVLSAPPTAISRLAEIITAARTIAIASLV